MTRMEMGQVGARASAIRYQQRMGAVSKACRARNQGKKTDGKIWLRRHDNGVLLQKRVGGWFVEMAMLSRRAFSCRIHRQQELSTVTMCVYSCATEASEQK
jgi:hypothetical protein